LIPLSKSVWFNVKEANTTSPYMNTNSALSIRNYLNSSFTEIIGNWVSIDLLWDLKIYNKTNFIILIV